MIVAQMKKGKQVFAYFNNTLGDAPFNALTLHEMVAKLGGLGMEKIDGQ